MNRRSIWLGSLALMAASAQGALAAEPELKPTTVGSGKTVIVETGNPFGGGFGGGFQPSRSMRLNLKPGAKMEKGSYLGISATSVTPVLRSQLKLQPGVGLVVESVEKDSPAAVAGVEQYDVLQQFNDQILIDTRQFGVLVRLAKPGDEVTLKVLRKGEPVSVKAKLVEKDVPSLDSDSTFGMLKEMNLDGVAKSVRGTLDNVTIERSDEPFFRAMDFVRKNKDAVGQFSYSDKGMTLQITQDEGKRQLVARRADGKVLYNGPINTEEERKALPPEVAQRLKDVYTTTTRPTKSDE